jgi:steroid delta-isomerase-like uncharacterized protein
MDLSFAQKWCSALGSDTEALAELYGTDGTYTAEHHMMDDHMKDTLTTREMLVEQLGGLAGGDGGTYTFQATEYRGDERWGIIHWNVRIEGARAFRGVENPEGKTLESLGSTFLQFKPDGTILLDSTFWNDNPIFQQLGRPIVTPHYWEEGFDPEALAG